MRRAILLFVAIAIFALPMMGQMPGGSSSTGMEDMPGMTHNHPAQKSFIDVLRDHATSGTDAEPASFQSQMFMRIKGE